jgi:hypothetical protein
MPINPNIALNPNRPVDPLTAFSMGRERKRVREQDEEIMQMKRDEQAAVKSTRQAEAERLSKEDELKSMARGALELLPSLNSVESVPRALSQLDARIQEIDSRGGNSSDSRFMRELIRAGRIDEAKQHLQTVVELGERFGVIEPAKAADEGGFTLSPGQSRFDAQGREVASVDPKAASQSDLPTDIQVYEYYNKLPPDEQEEMLLTMRGPEKPSSTLEKRLFEVNDSAFKASANVSRYNNVAEQMVAVDPASGVVAEWTEKYKQLTGQEDAVTELRKDWNNLRVSAAVQNLPPGVASDKDIELVMSAFLPEFANPETVASFMRGLSKLEGIKAEYHEFESDYLSRNGTGVGLNKAWLGRLENVAPAESEQTDKPKRMKFDAQGQPVAN